MDTLQIANRLVELCRQGKFDQAQEELYHKDAVSHEPPQSPFPTAKGLEGIKTKGKNFQSMIKENHGGYLTDPVVGGNHFSLGMGMDVTMKDGNRLKLDEICVYQVKDGKIILEQFYY